jgi:Ulp1 family protease
LTGVDLIITVFFFAFNILRVEWEFVVKDYVPQQTDGCSCGIFTLIGIEMIMESLPLLYDNRIANHLRMRYGVEIVDGKLNY